METAESKHGFHHVAIAASDFDRSVTFYTTTFGCTSFRSWGEVGDRATMLDLGNGNYLEIFERTDESHDQGRILHFAVRVDDCRAIHNAALTAGGTESRPPKEIDIPSTPVYPVTISFVFGPDGEEIELFQER